MDTTIRLVERRDAEALATHQARDREAFARFDPAQPAEFYTRDGQVDRIGRMLEAYRARALWPGVVLTDDVVIGQVTVGTIVRGPFRKGSVGYWIAVPHQGRRHARRALAMVIEVMAGELDLHRAEASTAMENTASQKVLRANGFESYGIAHSHIFLNGAWRDGVLWERTLSE